MRSFSCLHGQVTQYGWTLAIVSLLVLMLASSAPAQTANDDPMEPGMGQGPDDQGPPEMPPNSNGPMRDRRSSARDGRQPGPRPAAGWQPDSPPPFGPQGPGNGGPRGAVSEKTDPEMYKLLKSENSLEQRIRKAAAQCRQASGKENVDKAKEELQKLVTQQFDVRQQRRALEVKRFEQQIKQLRETSERREKNRKQLIEKRVADLVGQEESDF
jgi:hypothetical protein